LRVQPPRCQPSRVSRESRWHRALSRPRGGKVLEMDSSSMRTHSKLATQSEGIGGTINTSGQDTWASLDAVLGAYTPIYGADAPKNETGPDSSKLPYTAKIARQGNLTKLLTGCCRILHWGWKHFGVAVLRRCRQSYDCDLIAAAWLVGIASGADSSRRTSGNTCCLVRGATT
jgi:hypothetical protein